MTPRDRVARVCARLAAAALPERLGWAFGLLGFALRLEHALTFDGPLRGSDYAVHLLGVNWMLEHLRPFNLDPTVDYQVRSYPPLWYLLSGLWLRASGSEPSLALIAVAGWVVRQIVLGRLLRQIAPHSSWARCAALAIHAVLPLGILIDGKINPEGLHAAFYVLGLYALWRMEQQASQAGRISLRTSVWFGLFAGLALLTKGTALVLVASCACVVAWRVLCAVVASGWRRALGLWLRPTLVAALTWCMVAGWWFGPNLVQYGHPAPHVWDLEGPAQHPELAAPALYRRPLGWALPFEWREVLEFPLLRSPTEPRPNYWAGQITGTWSDYYNRGFCRLQGGEASAQVWGGIDGFIPQSPLWSVTFRCVRVYSALLRVGLFLTLLAVVAVFYTGWIQLRSWGARGSLALPTSVCLGTLFVLLFALVYPFDHMAVLNPRYLLPQAAPLSACLGLLLARCEQARKQGGFAGGLATLLIGTALTAIGAVTWLVVYERFGA